MKNNVYIIFALTRTGHHRIINWLGDCCNTKVVHFDDNKLDTKHNKLKKLGRRYDFFHKRKHKSYIYNLENFNIETFQDYNFKDLFEIEHSNIQYICIMRDLLNWLASSVRHNQQQRKGCKVDFWNSYAKQFVKEENYFGDINPYFIKFNDWFSDIDYRKNICNDLNLTFSDKYKIKQTIDGKSGSTSSFQKLKCTNDTTKLDVLNRYKTLSPKQLRKKHFNSEHFIEAYEYNKQIFNIDYDIELPVFKNKEE